MFKKHTLFAVALALGATPALADLPVAPIPVAGIPVMLPSGRVSVSIPTIRFKRYESAGGSGGAWSLDAAPAKEKPRYRGGVGLDPVSGATFPVIVPR